ncbi:MAG TPA: PilN domain-containing protein [Stellaceae bacterium]|nr:PilN domain-containing protein [Stellaceae bacterium]
MLRDLVEWWADQMLAFVPERLRLAMVESQDGLLVEPETESGGGLAVRLSRLHHREIADLGRYSVESPALGDAAARARAGTIRLRLPYELLLEKRLTLPLAAASELDRVLAYEMDRETPFTADEAWWSYALEQRDRQHGRIEVRLSLVPKAATEALLAALHRAGLRPTVIEIAVDGQERRQIPIGAPERRGGGIRARLVPVAAGVCLVLLAIAIGMPFLRQSWEMAATSARMDALKKSVDEAEGLRRQLASSAGADVLTNERSRLGDPMAVLAAATQILPDDTRLTDFTMEQRKVTMNGQSVAAAKLIGALAADPLFKDPAFAAPSTHMPGARTETFSISTEARP